MVTVTTAGLRFPIPDPTMPTTCGPGSPPVPSRSTTLRARRGIGIQGTSVAAHPGRPGRVDLAVEVDGDELFMRAGGAAACPRPVSGQLGTRPIASYVTSALGSTGAGQSRWGT
jgi:hypothetical protein